MVNHPRFGEFDTSTLRDVGGGGAPAPASLVAKVAGSIKGGGPVLGYGMTETNAYGPGNRGADYLARPTSTGRWVPVMDLEIRDDDHVPVPTGERGNIWFRGPMLIRGYWNKPEATAATIVDGWLNSGDIGRLDADGFLYIEDRAKDMILRGGENVYCAEIETAIYELPGIHEAAVFGVPHDRLGEEVAVAVHLLPGASLDAEAVRAHVATKLASFKVPAHVYFIDEPLPRNAAGKFLKRELTAQFASKN
jgi:long-chain acyl-CoA synthetase